MGELAMVDKVPFEIADFTSPQEGMEPGFYYSIPVELEDSAHPAERFFIGPYADKAAAIEAARAFIADALTDFTAAGEPGPPHLVVITNPDPSFAPRDADDDMA